MLGKKVEMYRITGKSHYTLLSLRVHPVHLPSCEGGKRWGRAAVSILMAFLRSDNYDDFDSVDDCTHVR